MTNYNDIINAPDFWSISPSTPRPKKERTVKTTKPNAVKKKKGKTEDAGRCSTNTSLVTLLKHTKALTLLLKEAEADGICLDELLDSARIMAE